MALEQRLEALRTFILREGHSDVPFGYIVSIDGVDLFLGQWVSAQRRSYHKGELGQKQIAAIEAMRMALGRAQRPDRARHKASISCSRNGLGTPGRQEFWRSMGFGRFMKSQDATVTSAPYQPDTSEERVARIQTRRRSWFVLAQVFAEYPKEEFPQSQSFLSNSALVAGTAVDLADSDEDRATEESVDPPKSVTKQTRQEPSSTANLGPSPNQLLPR